MGGLKISVVVEEDEDDREDTSPWCMLGGGAFYSEDHAKELVECHYPGLAPLQWERPLEDDAGPYWDTTAWIARPRPGLTFRICNLMLRDYVP